MRRRLNLIMALLFVSVLCGCTQKTNEGKSNETMQMTAQVTEVDSESDNKTLTEQSSENAKVVENYKAEDGKTFADIEQQIGGIADVSSITKNQITFETRVDLFSTYGITIPMKLENDKLVGLDSVIKFVNNPDSSVFDEFESLDADTKERIAKEYNEEGYKVLTLKKNMKSKSDNGDLEIKAGEQIIPYGYDESAQKFYFTYNDTICYFEYEFVDDEYNGYTFTINGVDEDDMFEALPYVG